MTSTAELHAAIVALECIDQGLADRPTSSTMPHWTNHGSVIQENGRQQTRGGSQRTEW